MIYAVGVGKDGRLLGLMGISRVNVERLQSGKPMMVDLSNFKGAPRIMIVYGEKEMDIMEALHKAGYMKDEDLEKAREYYKSGNTEHVHIVKDGEHLS